MSFPLDGHKVQHTISFEGLIYILTGCQNVIKEDGSMAATVMRSASISNSGKFLNNCE